MPFIKLLTASVVTAEGICNSVGGGVFLACYCGASSEYQSVSKLWLLIDIEIATCCWPFLLCFKLGHAVEKSIRMTVDRDKWKKYVYGVANPHVV